MEVKRMKVIRKRLAEKVAKQNGKNYFTQSKEKDDDSVDGGSSKNKVSPMPAVSAISSSAIDVGNETLSSGGGRSQKVVTFSSNHVEHILSTDSEHGDVHK